MIRAPLRAGLRVGLRVGLMIGIPLVLASRPVCAQPVGDLERDDSLALSIAWRLQTTNARYCARAAPATGIALQDSAAYDDPALVRRTYGLTGAIYVGALADDGPGATANLPVNTTVVAINAQPLAQLPPPQLPADPFTRASAAQAMLDNAAARDGAVTVTTGDGRTVRVGTMLACRVHIAVDDHRNYARATRDDIHIGRTHLDEAVARDSGGQHELLAAMIAHEMAHAVLDHQAVLAASHGAIGVARATEREADRLSVWLLANAGYPPDAAIAFQRQIIGRHAGFLTIDVTHGSWRARAAVIAGEIAALRSAPDADWAQRFVRTVAPARP